MKYDILFIHPPSIYDFRKNVIFPGPLSRTVANYTNVFTCIPIGVLSMAELLNRNGYKVKIVNLGELMLLDRNFNVEEFLKRNEADVYGIDLHFCVHSQGAIEISKLCKQVHPNSLVVLGGLTATKFHSDILREHSSIDAILRGEGEYPMLKLMEKCTKLSKVPNLSYKSLNGQMIINPMMKVCDDLDDFDFTRLDLIYPRKQMFVPEKGITHWFVPIYRGCNFNCVSCGGSKYTYRTLLKRNCPAFRSPEKIGIDLQHLSEQGVNSIFIFQDMRMAGKKYSEELLRVLRRTVEQTKIDLLLLELFTPPERKFLEDVSRLNCNIKFTMSPESGVKRVRRAHGRYYSNEDIMKTAIRCKDLNIFISFFFMLGLAEQTYESVAETWRLWDKIIALNERNLLIRAEVGTMLPLDPGSLAFDFPKKYGYHLLFDKFEDYYHWIDHLSWKHWISYETRFLKREDLVKLTSRSQDVLIALFRKYGFCDFPTYIKERCKILYNRITADVGDRFTRGFLYDIQ